MEGQRVHEPSFACRARIPFTAHSCREWPIRYSRPGMRIVVDDQPIEYVEGDSVAVAIVRAGQHPQHGGTLCLAGDCGNCCAEIDGVAFTRTCLTAARPGLRVTRHPAVGAPPLHLEPPINPVASPSHATATVRRERADVVVIGAGDSGTAAADAARADGRARHGARRRVGSRRGRRLSGPGGDRPAGERRHAARARPRCRDRHWRRRAASRVRRQHAARDLHRRARPSILIAGGVDLGVVATVDLEQLWQHRRCRRAVDGVVTDDGTSTPCNSVVVTSRAHLTTRPAGPHGQRSRTCEPRARRPPTFELPPCPTAGIVCPCSKVTVDDLQMVWDKGFQHLELIKRAALCGTGTCQGGVCMPHLRRLRRRQVGSTGRAVHRPAGLAPVDDRRGRGRHVPRSVPAHRPARRAHRPRGAHGSFRWMVAALELRRLPRRVLGRA